MHHRQWWLTSAISTAFKEQGAPTLGPMLRGPALYFPFLFFPIVILDHIMPCPSSPSVFPEPFISWLCQQHASLGLRRRDIRRGGRSMATWTCNMGMWARISTYIHMSLPQWRSALENANKSPIRPRTPTQRLTPWTPQDPHSTPRGI